jgi:hypothetical protein
MARLDGSDRAGKQLHDSAWDVRPYGSAGFFDQRAGQDSWSFETLMREFSQDFHLGVLCCDNQLA